MTIMGTEPRIRPAGAADGPALTAALLEAVNWAGRARFRLDDLDADSTLSRYVEGWPRLDDFGAIAESDGLPVGAAWCRTFSSSAPGYGFVADDVPELSMGVLPAHRGRGVGTALLTAVLGLARQRSWRAVSLSVEDGNRARALYERVGFVRVGRKDDSDVLLVDLTVSGDRSG